ncbi:MAG: D-alanyl-D-alanine carboxypeptidase family protein [Mesorhizobium sp.]
MISLRSTRFAAFAAVLTAAATFSANAGPSILVDGNTGVVLEQNDAFARWYPASLTKLMTTYVAFRAIDAGEVTLASPVRVSINATKEKPSKMGYPAGTVVTLENALRMIMVKSANDIATAIGESLGGSTEAFAARMNSEAKRIGMTGSNFVNPHGWHDERQYTTAHDMAVLALALKRDYPQYASFFDIEALSDGKVMIANHNDMIFRFEGADGMKTGYTCDAGYNLVVSANRNGRTMVAVVLGATSVGGRTDDAAELLAAGFGIPPRTGTTVDRLAPSGSGIDQATNMRQAICSPEARKQRLEKLDAKGNIIFKSAHITGGKIPTPRPTQISLGGATGPASPYYPKVARPDMIDGIPVPIPRPVYAGASSESASAKSGVTQ